MCIINPGHSATGKNWSHGDGSELQYQHAARVMNILVFSLEGNGKSVLIFTCGYWHRSISALGKAIIVVSPEHDKAMGLGHSML